jgi:endonuclease YncB( thermonuclease family)
MPFINGRFYINPAYCRALERARRAEGVWSEQFPEFAQPLLREEGSSNDASSR